MRARRGVGVFAMASALLLVGCAGAASAPTGEFAESLPGAAFHARVADTVTAASFSDGDLWPTCWSDDDALYSANGDGAGFGTEFFDIAVNRITGSPTDEAGLDGTFLGGGDAVGEVWSGEGFTRKPTGMLCVDGELYLAVQDLRLDFNEAPAATIARSVDHGRTWTWDTSAPMFDDGVFTTVWFADYGKDSEHAPDAAYAYAYGLDDNWRDSFDDSVPDPTELFLARVPVTSVQDASTWEFYSGDPGDPEPTWSRDISEKRPVLVDERVQHPDDLTRVDQGTAGPRNLTVISQGGVTYLPKLDRYIYTSWTELTFEFYESPTPWGPWTLFLSEDFGPYPWTDARFGGYATAIPSKFLSDDNLTMWVQSNVCPCAPAGLSSYWFGLRPLQLKPVER